jgi:hypothetical protein
MDNPGPYSITCDDFPSQTYNTVDGLPCIEGAFMIWARLVMDGHEATLTKWEDDRHFKDLAWHHVEGVQ